MEYLSYVLYLIFAAGGFFIGYFFYKKSASSKIGNAAEKADKIVSEAKIKEKDLLLKAQDKALGIIEESKKEEANRRNEINSLQKRLEQRETSFSQKLLDLQEKQQKLFDKVNEVQEIKERIKKIKEEQDAKLEFISGLSAAEAKDLLLKNVEEKSADDLMIRINKLENNAEESLGEKAKNIMALAMQRMVSSYTVELTTTTVDLPNDEMKGRIIGKEGRNIKTIEKLTGCELIIDETPELILISSFSPIRRRVCAVALEKLIKDGRIQPAKIEEFIEEAKKELAIDIKKAGQESLNRVGIVVPDDKLVSIIGRLKYRTSYGQNVLNHSEEVAFISALIAEEIGVDPAKAKKAGYFHDIGKAVDHESEGAHTQIGETILKKFSMDADLAEVALTHHDTNPPSVLTKIVMAADAISSSRVGARRDSIEQYVARLNELEGTAKSFPGVEKAYAIQAGREIRVFINPSEVDDYQSYNLAKDIARKIEAEHQYPGEIKVMVIRENRAIEYAR